MAYPPLYTEKPIAQPLPPSSVLSASVITGLFPAARQLPDASCTRSKLPTNFVADLNNGEHLIIWMFRRLAAARIWCPVIDHEIKRLLCRNAGDIRTTLQLFLAQIAQKGCRRLRIGMPGYPLTTHDEQLVLALLAAAQDQNLFKMQAMLPFLLGSSEVTEMQSLVLRLAQGFSLNGMTIRAPAPHRLDDDSQAHKRQDSDMVS